jgi:hypothetical protein
VRPVNPADCTVCVSINRRVYNQRKLPRRKCRTTKKQDEFYFNNLVEDGLTTYCRACHQDKGSPAPGPDGAVPVRSGTRYNVTQPTKSEKHCKCATVLVCDLHVV